MATWRVEGEECPIPPKPILSMDICQPCIFFRGASSVGIGNKKWKINCNFPRNGSDIWKPLEKPLDDYTNEEIRNMTR